MKKYLITLLALFITISSFAGNWYTLNGTIQPVISSSPTTVGDSIVSLTGMYKWDDSSSFMNDNHLCRLVRALPPSLDGTTATPQVKVNGVVMNTAIFTQNLSWVSCTFPPGTVFPPQALIEFTLSNLKVDVTTSYVSQLTSHWITFIAAPSETFISDNVFSFEFKTLFKVPQEEDNVSVPVVIEEYAITYPNPATNTLYVEYSVGSTSIVGVKIFNKKGKLFKSIVTKSVSGKYTVKLDISKLPKGTYYVKVTKNKGVLVNNKVIVK